MVAGPTPTPAQKEVLGTAMPGSFPLPVYKAEQNAPARASFELSCFLVCYPRLWCTGHVSEGNCQQQFVASLIASRSNEVSQFEVPSLRNETLAGPYWHDGRFATLA